MTRAFRWPIVLLTMGCAAAAATLLVTNGRQNRVTQSDGRTEPVHDFSLRQGNIEQPWLNRSPERP
jgi:hypothetical protein